MTAKQVTVIGAGMGGLAAALALSGRGIDVTVLERANTPGGKMREIAIGNARIDAGPTVFTMRWVFDEIFAAAEADLADHVRLQPATTLARHAWREDERLDLFADIDQSADAIGDFAGAAEARGYRQFCARAKRIYDILETPFIKRQKPNLPELMWRVGLHRPVAQYRINPYQTMWSALGEYFKDARLRQLFGRYSTYCGASPYMAPATLMLVAHCERGGVWMAEGGMHSIAVQMARLAEARGVTIRYQAHVAGVYNASGRAAGVTLADGERIEADAIIVNADPSSVSASLFGADAAKATPPMKPSKRSLSAMTYALVAATDGFPLLRHNVFFSQDYAAEFGDILNGGRLPQDPTVYVCAQDRNGEGGETLNGPERLLCVVNARPCGDTHEFDQTEIEQCQQRTFQRLERCGLRVEHRPESIVATSPSDFERLFPATGGALYGRASHGWMASFRRPGARSRMRGLYFAGGSAHPGPGAPMAALSGRLAAERVIADLASM
ncbi:MAG: phytoene desaturase family protein [Hyphomicrobiales bacterium]|nr:phytoene desaturase family protein [Hyphomicrobiales bacterium]